MTTYCTVRLEYCTTVRAAPALRLRAAPGVRARALCRVPEMRTVPVKTTTAEAERVKKDTLTWIFWKGERRGRRKCRDWCAESPLALVLEPYRSAVVVDP